MGNSKWEAQQFIVKEEQLKSMHCIGKILQLTGVDIGVLLQGGREISDFHEFDGKTRNFHLFHVAFLMESFATVLARIGPSIAVDEEVSREGARSLERLSALLAFEDLFHVVHRSVGRRKQRKLNFDKAKRPRASITDVD